jgi:methyl-accepting chemotaxis protein
MTITKKSQIIISLFLGILVINTIGTFFNTNEIEDSSSLLTKEIIQSSKLSELKYIIKELQEVSTNIALIGEKDRFNILSVGKQKYDKLFIDLKNNSSSSDKKRLTDIQKEFKTYFEALENLAKLGIEKSEAQQNSKALNETFNKSIVVAETALRMIRKEVPRLERTKLKLLIVTTKEILTNALVVATQKEVDDSVMIRNAVLNYTKVISKKFPESTQKMQSLKTDYLNFYNDGVKLAQQGVLIETKSQHINTLMVQVTQNAAVLQKNIEKIVLQKQQKLESTIEKNNDNIATLQATSIFYALLFLGGVIFLFLMLRKTVTTITQFKEELILFFKYLNNEAKEIELLNETTKDEFAQMAIIVNENILKTKQGLEEDRALVNETINVLKEYEYGNFTPRIQLSVQNEVLTELKTLLNQMGVNMEKNINDVLNVLNEFADYNYTHKVPMQDLKEHLKTLAQGVNHLGDSISNMLKINYDNGLLLQHTATTLSSNVKNFSHSANEQAASLEETSAALEELTSSVNNDMQIINQVSNYSTEVTQSIETGENLANKTAHSMNEINEQTNAITEAISVIDQIAFQTNILSLNAAVEAATAGEAGKGFAVVAAEVRNLASRSAEAAHEIKELVETANAKTNEGKKASDDMINGYERLSTNVGKTIDGIKTIADSAKEQQTGLAQINDVVATLDKATQENAHTASQTDAIAKKTEEIASSLLEEANKSTFLGKA